MVCFCFDRFYKGIPSKSLPMLPMDQEITIMIIKILIITIIVRIILVIIIIIKFF